MEENKNIESNEQQENIPDVEQNKIPPASGKPSSSVPQSVPEAEQPITHNSPPLTEQDMEVHHHTHESHGNPPAGRAGKNWKSYFWEFLMLFLAVFCGFLAENQREHYIENNREKQYAGLLIADLESDTTFFNKEATRLSGLQNRFDTLINLLRQPVSAPNDLIANQLFHINYVSDAKLIAATYNQMKASGSLRYIKNPRLIASLQEYYEIQLPRCIKSSESSLQFFREYLLSFFINNVRHKKSQANGILKDDQSLIIGRSPDADQRLSNIIERHRQY